ncbi:MAG: DUF1161 domain-containing protein [Burkholderiales bacterium]
MKKTALALILAFAVTPALAQRKDCNELKSEIDAKIEKNGVKAFNTTIVDKDAQAEGKVVGTCDGGTKKIVYSRGEMPSQDGMAKPTSKQ